LALLARATPPKAVLLGWVAMAPFPTAVAPDPPDAAASHSPVSKVPVLPELHPAIAGTAERASAPAAKTQLASSAPR
jgi:hypothetical protein